MASIRKRPKKDGFSYTVLWREPGQRNQSSFACDTEAEAELLKRLLDANNQSMEAAERILGDAGAGGPTVREMILKHIDLLTGAGPYQIKRYRKSVDHHFSGTLGNLRVATLKHADIVAWIRVMQAKNLSAKTIANHHGLLSAAMKTAVQQEIRETSPCAGVKLPKDTNPDEVMRFMTHEEWGRIMEHIDSHYEPFFQFLLGTGLRFSEATALQGSDFKLDGNPPTVRVSKAWKEDGDGKFYVGPPKTKKARRTVSMAPSTVFLVRPLVESAGSGLVFKNKQGNPIRSSLAHKVWGPACLGAGYTEANKPRIHDVRHSSASYLAHAGMDIFQLSHRLGHASITVTMDRYSHLLPEAHFNGAQMAAKALSAI